MKVKKQPQQENPCCRNWLDKATHCVYCNDPVNPAQALVVAGNTYCTHLCLMDKKRSEIRWTVRFAVKLWIWNRTSTTNSRMSIIILVTRASVVIIYGLQWRLKMKDKIEEKICQTCFAPILYEDFILGSDQKYYHAGEGNWDFTSCYFQSIKPRREKTPWQKDKGGEYYPLDFAPIA